MKKFIIITLILIALFFSCATTIMTRMVTQNFDSQIQKKNVIDAITYALMNNGFEIAMINENYGLINTSYRKVISGTDTALSVLSVVASAMSRGPSSYSTFEREMMISFQLTINGYNVIPKVRRISNTNSYFSSSSSNYVEYPTSESAEGKLVNKIIFEINNLLNVNTNIVWSEKEISISENN